MSLFRLPASGRPTAPTGFAVTCLALLPVIWLGAAPALAEPVYDFATTPGKLPKTVVPAHYQIDLVPDIGNLTFAGSEVIDIDVREPTARVVLNAMDLAVTAASVEDDTAPATDIALDPKAQTLTLTFAHPLAAGAHKLHLAFTGKINMFDRGLFAVDYPTADGRKRMISTQLEAADARRIFPGWDEPVFKATFGLTVTLPQDFLAVSNMPPAGEEALGNGIKRVTFPATPKMSSYLLVLTAGDLERRTADADGTTVGIVTTRGKVRDGQYALDSAVDLLRYYNGYFGTRYPLPKLDLIAIPGGFGGAMENWGGITFFESRLLFDPAVSAADARRGIFGIIAHEMAHQWFGDLVTMAWWDNLWLNEGFASWMQAKAAESLHPEWLTWLNSIAAKEAAMQDDARRTTHPIQQPIADESDADAAFDLITYNKGQAFIRMLESYLGDDPFRTGIQAYMKRHAFSSTTTADLWTALEAASGKPVAAIAAAYTEQPGIPLVAAQSVCANGRQHIALRQERFTIHDPNPQLLRWELPVLYGTVGKPLTDALLLDGSAEIPVAACDESVKLNLGDVGYYRVHYDAPSLAKLTSVVRQMAPADRVNLLADTWAMIEAGTDAPATYFDLLDRIGDDDTRAIVDQIVRTFARIDHLERGRPGRTPFQAYARAVLRPVFDRVGWEASPGESPDRTILRGRLIGILGAFGDQDVLAEAKRRFAGFLKEPASLSVDLRVPIIALVARTADRATYDALLGLGRKTTNTDERVRYYSAAAGALDPALARATLAITLTDELPSTMIGTLINQVASQGEQPELAWTFVQENFAVLEVKKGPSFRNQFASNLLTNFTDAAHAIELENFAPVHETSGGRMVAARAQEIIMIAADQTARLLPVIDARVGASVAPPR